MHDRPPLSLVCRQERRQCAFYATISQSMRCRSVVATLPSFTTSPCVSQFSRLFSSPSVSLQANQCAPTATATVPSPACSALQRNANVSLPTATLIRIFASTRGVFLATPSAPTVQCSPNASENTCKPDFAGAQWRRRALETKTQRSIRETTTSVTGELHKE